MLNFGNLHMTIIQLCSISLEIYFDFDFQWSNKSASLQWYYHVCKIECYFLSGMNKILHWEKDQLWVKAARRGSMIKRMKMFHQMLIVIMKKVRTINYLYQSLLVRGGSYIISLQLSRIKHIFKAFNDFKNKQQLYELFFLVSKSIYILKVYSIHYTLT